MELAGLGYIGLFIGAFLASTVLLFSSDAMFVAALLAGGDPSATIAVMTLGNWLGGLTTYYIGYLGRWEWIEKYLRIKREKLEAQREVVNKYGALVALATWLPFIGDVLTVAIGFYKLPFVKSAIYMFIGRALRFIVWALIIYATKL